MPKGLKQTSSEFFISASVTESAIGTFTESTVSLPLNSLDREVFVITGILMDPATPSSVLGTQTTSTLQLTRQTATGVLDFGDFNLVAISSDSINGGVAEYDFFNKTYGNQLQETGTDYVDVIATPNMYVQVVGANNVAPLTSSIRVYGYRAQADSSVYSALIASELNA